MDYIIINGDLNAKSGKLDDTIPPDKFDDEFHTCIYGNPPKRNPQDKKVNKGGIELVDMCKSLELNIINGRKTGDPFGKYTCFTWNGNSVVDYLLTPDSLFPPNILIRNRRIFTLVLRPLPPPPPPPAFHFGGSQILRKGSSDTSKGKGS